MSEEGNDKMNKEDGTHEGSCIFFKHSYGFLTYSVNGVKQKDLFCHYSDIIGQDGKYRTLRKNDRVSFQIGKNHDGIDKAISVKVLESTKD